MCLVVGRGNGVANLPGNKIYRNTVQNSKNAFRVARGNKAKRAVADYVIMSIKNLGGNFYYQKNSVKVKNQNLEEWVVAPYDDVLRKVKQALREKNKKEQTSNDNGHGHGGATPSSPSALTVKDPDTATVVVKPKRTRAKRKQPEMENKNIIDLLKEDGKKESNEEEEDNNENQTIKQVINTMTLSQETVHTDCVPPTTNSILPIRTVKVPSEKKVGIPKMSADTANAIVCNIQHFYQDGTTIPEKQQRPDCNPLQLCRSSDLRKTNKVNVNDMKTNNSTPSLSINTPQTDKRSTFTPQILTPGGGLAIAEIQSLVNESFWSSQSQPPPPSVASEKFNLHEVSQPLQQKQSQPPNKSHSSSNQTPTLNLSDFNERNREGLFQCSSTSSAPHQRNIRTRYSIPSTTTDGSIISEVRLPDKQFLSSSAYRQQRCWSMPTASSTVNSNYCAVYFPQYTTAESGIINNQQATYHPPPLLPQGSNESHPKQLLPALVSNEPSRTFLSNESLHRQVLYQAQEEAIAKTPSLPDKIDDADIAKIPSESLKAKVIDLCDDLDSIIESCDNISSDQSSQQNPPKVRQEGSKRSMNTKFSFSYESSSDEEDLKMLLKDSSMKSISIKSLSDLEKRNNSSISSSSLSPSKPSRLSKEDSSMKSLTDVNVSRPYDDDCLDYQSTNHNDDDDDDNGNLLSPLRASRLNRDETPMKSFLSSPDSNKNISAFDYMSSTPISRLIKNQTSAKPSSPGRQEQLDESSPNLQYINKQLEKIYGKVFLQEDAATADEGMKPSMQILSELLHKSLELKDNGKASDQERK